MITIDQEQKIIRFVPDKSNELHPPERSFPLLSAYVCHFCRKILAAYFQGKISDVEVEMYRQEKMRYIIGSVGGGHYVKVEHHGGYNDPNQCVWEVFSKRGIVENLRLFMQKHEIPLMLIQALSNKIPSIPGFRVLEDVCKRDKEMLLFSEDALLGMVREKEGFDVYWKTKMNLGKYLMELVEYGNTREE